MGGKDPMVVFSDADLDVAAEQAVTFSLYNCGQVCRLFVSVETQQISNVSHIRYCITAL
jgi:hypothetical protein